MKKTLATLLTAAALAFSVPNAANCQATASHGINFNIEVTRALYVNENDEIIGIGVWSNGEYIPEDQVVIFKNRSRIGFNDKIREQYSLYLNDPTIDWGNRPGWHYYNIFPESIRAEEKIFTEKTPEKKPGTIITETEEDGVIYTTITEE